MTFVVRNAQRAWPVPVARMAAVARRAAKRLKIAGPGRFEITFVDPARMRGCNRAFLGHDWPTDVLSFRYEPVPGRPPAGQVLGEVLIAPAEAAAYARRHGVAYEQELSRYVAHGLLHWLGHEDGTPAQQAAMRAAEDRALAGLMPRARAARMRRATSRRTA